MNLPSLKSAASKREARVTKLVTAMIVSFVTVWTPYAACAIYVLITADGGEQVQMGHGIGESPLTVFPLLFAKSSTFLNPFLYVGLNPMV